jgi:putative PIN family toxin of toxin-antitoxin system
LPPEEVAGGFFTAGNDHHAGIERRDFLGFEHLVEGSGEEAGGDGDDLLQIAVEPQRRVFAFKIREQERVLVALAVSEAATNHFLAKVESRGVQGVRQATAVGAFEAGGEFMEAFAVDADDDVAAAGQVDAEGIFVVLLEAASEVVFHMSFINASIPIVANSGCMRVVLDTNVLLSACLKPAGLEAQMVDRALAGELVACVTEEVWAEYQDVLLREKFRAVRVRAEWMLASLEPVVVRVEGGEPVTVATDEDDNRFLECAAAARAAFLVTGNLRHYPAAFGETAVVNARLFLDALK